MFDSKKMMKIRDTRELFKRIVFPGNTRYFVRDISGANCYGYKFGIFKQRQYDHPVTGERFWEDLDCVLKSESVYDKTVKNVMNGYGAVCNYFDRSKIDSLLSEEV